MQHKWNKKYSCTTVRKKKNVVKLWEKKFPAEHLEVEKLSCPPGF